MFVDNLAQPNCLACSPGDNILHIAYFGLLSYSTRSHPIRTFGAPTEGRVTGGVELVAINFGMSDDYRVDLDGNSWTNSGGVLCIRSRNEPLGMSKLSGMASNVAFGGWKRNRLYICGHTPLCGISVGGSGCLRP